MEAISEVFRNQSELENYFSNQLKTIRLTKEIVPYFKDLYSYRLNNEKKIGVTEVMSSMFIDAFQFLKAKEKPVIMNQAIIAKYLEKLSVKTFNKGIVSKIQIDLFFGSEKFVRQSKMLVKSILAKENKISCDQIDEEFDDMIYELYEILCKKANSGQEIDCFQFYVYKCLTTWCVAILKEFGTRSRDISIDTINSEYLYDEYFHAIWDTDIQAKMAVNELAEEMRLMANLSNLTEEIVFDLSFIHNIREHEYIAQSAGISIEEVRVIRQRLRNRIINKM